jgi:membrane-bound inhibitor of C-type lysozyme
LAAAQAEAARNVIHYACPGREELTVQRDASRPQVSLDGRTYDLQRKRSSIGDKYLSTRAALIIEGPSAVFVAEHRFDIGTCIRASSVASLP